MESFFDIDVSHNSKVVDFENSEEKGAIFNELEEKIEEVFYIVRNENTALPRETVRGIEKLQKEISHYETKTEF